MIQTCMMALALFFESHGMGMPYRSVGWMLVDKHRVYTWMFDEKHNTTTWILFAKNRKGTDFPKARNKCIDGRVTLNIYEVTEESK